jgi:hypothetical protein
VGFAEYKDQAEDWITIFETDFYPDTLEPATVQYGPVVKAFGDLLGEASNSVDLLRLISAEKQPLRGQLLRVFRRYVSPDTSVEGLKVKSKIERTITAYSARFRPLEEVAAAFARRPDPDEALIALLGEQADRAGKGYDLTEAFFTWTEAHLDEEFEIEGPRRAGSDVMLDELLPSLGARIPADFVIRKGGEIVAVGFARYDSDRGGSQEDDRIGGNRDKIVELLTYSREHDRPLKILLVNDGPGLTLGSMWNDYASLEALGSDGEVRVCTLKMLDHRQTADWLQA